MSTDDKTFCIRTLDMASYLTTVVIDTFNFVNLLTKLINFFFVCLKFINNRNLTNKNADYLSPFPWILCH